MPICPNCTCDNCRPHNEQRARVVARVAELTLRASEHRAAVAGRHAVARRDALSEGLVIWLLINAGYNVETLARLIERDYSYVQARRKAFVIETDKRCRAVVAEHLDPMIVRLRTAGAIGFCLHSGNSWAALPRSATAELPEECTVCGASKTEGRECRRCRWRKICEQKAP